MHNLNIQISILVYAFAKSTGGNILSRADMIWLKRSN